MKSPFLELPESNWIASNAEAFAIFDSYPVSPGHVLVVTKRLFPTWFDTTPQEQLALMELVNRVKNELDQTLNPKPDGYNVGFNAGDAAGQTVPHVHLHVIPRYRGDVDDPRGGVRHVIPKKGNYLAPEPMQPESIPTLTEPQLTGPQLNAGHPHSPLWQHLSWRIPGARCIDVLASFVQISGLDVIENCLFEAIRNDASIRILVSDYLYISDPHASGRLLGWVAAAGEVDPQESSTPRLFVRLIEMGKIPSKPASFHPKAWRISNELSGFIAIGSSNLSRPALESGIEWNLLATRNEAPEADAQMAVEFESLWLTATPLTNTVVENYTGLAQQYRVNHFEPESIATREPTFLPRPWQVEALRSLNKIRSAGYCRALVAVATGMGKTWLAAFDIEQVGRQLGRRPRVLVIAHRAHMLAQAETAISQVLDASFSLGTTTWYVGNQSRFDGDLVIASIQKLMRPAGLDSLSAEHFDYVEVDEVHHAHAPSYRRVLARCRGDFVLGLTATPERSDGVDVATIFDDNLAYQATIGDGIAEESLVPFHYIGLKDSIDFRQIPWRNGRFEFEASNRDTQQEAAVTIIEPKVGRAAEYSTHVPVYDVSAAAGYWGPEGQAEQVGWIRVPNQPLKKGMFAVQVIGDSMEPKIPSGAICLFRPCPAGSREGRLLLVQVNTHELPEEGGRYTVKRYHSQKRATDEGWVHQMIELQPLNPAYRSIVINAEDADSVRVIGEFMGVVEAEKE